MLNEIFCINYHLKSYTDYVNSVENLIMEPDICYGGVKKKVGHSDFLIWFTPFLKKRKIS